MARRKKEEAAPPEVEYAGFSVRLFASMVDMLLTFVLFAPFFPQGDYPPQLLEIVRQHRTGEITEAEANAMAFEFMIAGGGFAHAFSLRFTEMMMMGVVVVLFWVYRAATPGKMLFGLKIVDSRTGEAPGKIQCVIRYLAYILSGVPLGLGFVWIALNKKRRGWHDYLARTVVIVERESTVWQRVKQPFGKFFNKDKQAK